MSNRTLDATIFVYPDTKIVSQVWRDPKAGLIALIRWDGLTIHFSPDLDGRDLSRACDVLTEAIARVRAEVQPDPEAERDERIDADLGTGYIGEFTR